jgi:two-component system, NarL family, nitrate/nitrite response regulator NarL
MGTPTLLESLVHPGAHPPAQSGFAPESIPGPFPGGMADTHVRARHQASQLKRPIRLLLVNHHPVLREGIASWLGRHHHLAIVGQASDGPEALVQARLHAADIVLMDIDMPHLDGLAVTEDLRKELPQIKVLIFSVRRQTKYVLLLLRCGARGYVLKEASPEELLSAIESVHRGQTFLSPGIARCVLHHFVRGNGNEPSAGDLTEREREVLIHIAEGLSNQEIADKLGRGLRTVETHRERIMRKLDIHNIAGLTSFAIANGLVLLRAPPLCHLDATSDVEPQASALDENARLAHAL